MNTSPIIFSVRISFALAATAAVLTASNSQAAEPVPPLTDLGTLGGAYSYAQAINNHGVVAGEAQTSDGALHGFIWDAQNGMQDIGTLGGSWCNANAINDLGEVAGASETSNGETHAFIWDSVNGMQDLGTLGGTQSLAYGINNTGQIVGGSYVQGDIEMHPFIWEKNSGLRDLGTFGGVFGVAQSVNDQGDVVGVVAAGDPGGHAFIWNDRLGIRYLGELDLSIAGSINVSSAVSVNASGQVVGWSQAWGGSEPTEDSPGDFGPRASNAFIWDAVHGMRPVGEAVSGSFFKIAQSINRFGQVVGWQTNPDSESAFAWNKVNGMTDLGSLGGIVTTAYGINDLGQIVGTSWVTGQPHAFVVSIAPPPADPIIASISPTSVQAGSGDLELTIYGSGFVDGTTNVWNTTGLLPTSRTETEIHVTIPAEFLQTTADLETVAIRVKSPTGELSNSKAFTIVGDSGNVADVQGAVAVAGEPATVSIPPSSGSGVEATLNHSGDQPATVTAAVYNNDPSPSGASFEVAGAFLDLNVGGATLDDSMDAVFYYNGNAAAVALKFYNSSAAAWEDVTPVINNAALSRFEVHFDANSHPRITELTGTFFAAAIPDHIAPTIACANVVVPANIAALVPVNYPLPSTLADNLDQPSQITVRYSIPSGSGFGVGTTTVTCKATDRAGNTATTAFTVTRQPLGFAGFDTPIGGSDTSGGTSASPVRTFKFGSTIPVKFSASASGAAVTSGIHQLQALRFSNNTVAGAPIDATPQDAATIGNQFRLVSGGWQFNLDTKATGMSIGVWQLIATLSDGSKHTCWIQLK